MKHWIIPLLFLGALTVRLFGATYSPPSPYWEEAALGYDAYSILQTGRDHHGQLFPLVAFTSFGDYKPSLYFYAVVPSVALLGLNTLAVRLPAILASAGTVALLYLILKQWVGEKPARWSAILLMFQPWSWQVGRAGFETNLATFLIMLGVWLLNQATFTQSQARPPRFLLLSCLSAIAFSLSMYAYHGARIIAPLSALAVFAITFNWTNQPTHWLKIFRAWLPATIIGVVLTLPIILALQTPQIQQRFAETSIFTNSQPVELSNQYRAIANNSLTSRILYHRYWLTLQNVAGAYFSHLSPGFLFLKGDENVRHTSGWLAALYPWESVTILVGLVYGVRHFKTRKHWYLLLILLVLSPLAASITLATPHALRTLPLSPWLAAISGIGLTHLLGKKRWLHVFAALLIVLSWAVLAFYFFSVYRVKYATQWQYGYQLLFDYLTQTRLETETVYVSRELGRPSMYLFFTQQIEPSQVQAQSSSAAKDQQEILEFAHWRFGEDRSSSGLHAVTTGSLPDGTEPIHQVIGLDGKPIWEIYRVD